MPSHDAARVLQIGPFRVRIHCDIPAVKQGLDRLYADYPQHPSSVFCDFQIRLFPPVGIRRFIRKQVIFAFDQFIPFKPLPYNQAMPFFEWGLNWCISGYAHRFLIIHAAVIEKHGKALMMPGTPGAGKSTLCAALVNQGWRLLSDELTLIDCQSGVIQPVPRPVSLKNQSIDLIAQRYPDAIFSPVVNDTLKGSVALMKPPQAAVVRADETAMPAVVVFPAFQPHAELSLAPLSQATAFMKLADLSFNYSVLGSVGFDVLANMVADCRAYDFAYAGDFDQAAETFDALLGDAAS